MKITLGELKRRIAAALTEERLWEAGDDDKEGDDEGEDDAAAEDLFADDEEGDDKDAPDGDAGGDDGQKPDGSDATPDGASLDSQVDNLFIGLEKEASGKGLHAEGRDLYGRMTRRFLMLEADDEPELPADMGDDDGPGGKFDADAFASSVARLVENFDNLVDVRRTVVRRAEGFLRKAHSDDDVERFLESLREQHGLDSDETRHDQEDDVQAPPAAGAGPAGAGA